MLINGNNSISSRDKTSDVPVCSKTELLVRDGRNYARFINEFTREIDASGVEQDSARESGEGQGGIDLLLQLL